MSVGASETQPSLPIGSSLGPYQLMDLIAVGGMAEVYLARARALDGNEKLFALKVIQAEYGENPTFVQMLTDEARLAVTLHHPNIVQTFDLGQIGRVHFLSMEYVDGGDFYHLLRDITDAGGEVPIPAALWVARDMLLGLAYAHEKIDDLGQPVAIIHRDISPQNILLSRDGAVKLVDFGIAKAANVSSSTRAGVIKGKLVYMSPEQSWGDPLDQRSDLFSAGVVIYEALIGGSLYLETNPVRLLQKVRKADIPPPSSQRADISPELDELVMRAVAVRPQDRYQSAREVIRAIEGYLSRHHPGFTRKHLARLVSSVREGGGADFLASDSMERDDFPIANHSIIFPERPMPGSMEQGIREQKVPGQANGDAMSAKIVLVAADGTQTTYPVNEQLVIGRGGDLRLSDGRVSRRHARIVAHEGEYVLEDLSANGTFLNDEKMSEIRPLEHGDRIRIGPFKMQFLLDESTVPRSPHVGGPPLPPPPAGVPAPVEPAQPPALAPAEVEASAPISEGGAAQQPEPPEPPKRTTRPFEEAKPDAVAKAPEEPLPPPPPAQSPAAALADAMHRAPVDATAQDRSCGTLLVQLGDETIRVPLGAKTPLGQQLDVGSMMVNGPSSTVLRRSDGYWIEPVPRRERVRVNGKPLERPIQLNSGDRILVGALELEFLLIS